MGTSAQSLDSEPRVLMGRAGPFSTLEARALVIAVAMLLIMFCASRPVRS